MKHIWNMFKLVRFLEENQALFAFYFTKEQREEFIKAMWKVSTREKRVSVDRTMLAIRASTLFVRKQYFWFKKFFSDESRKERMFKSVNKSNDIIDDCISAGFLEKSGKDDVRLTSEGTKFITFSYFLKYFQKDLGATYTWVLGIGLSLFVGIFGTFFSERVWFVLNFALEKIPSI